jgi:hypothetical protein
MLVAELFECQRSTFLSSSFGKANKKCFFEFFSKVRITKIVSEHIRHRLLYQECDLFIGHSPSLPELEWGSITMPILDLATHRTHVTKCMTSSLDLLLRSRWFAMPFELTFELGNPLRRDRIGNDN